MSYSRWSYSNWYVFWEASSGNTRETQKLAIWHVADDRLPTFSYEELKNIENIQDLKKLLKLEIPESDYEELLEYVKEFIKDVDREFSKPEISGKQGKYQRK